MPDDQPNIDLAVEQHITGIWPGRAIAPRQWPHGRITVEAPDFRVLEVQPETPDGGWAYVSVGAWHSGSPGQGRQEFVILSPQQSEGHVETLTMVATMHAESRYRIGEGKVLDIGRPWLPGSACDHLLAVAPYFLEDGQGQFRKGEVEVSLLWLVAITATEAAFGREVGGHALFHELADAEVDLLQVDRQPLK